MALDTSIRKRQFYKVQRLGEQYDTGTYLISSRTLHGRTTSKAEVTFDGQRYTAFFEMAERTPLLSSARDYAIRIMNQKTTRHISGPSFDESQFQSCWIALSRPLITSIEFNPHIVPHHALFDWCRDNLVNWHEVLSENHNGEALFAVFENENDAIHTRMRWA